MRLNRVHASFVSTSKASKNEPERLGHSEQRSKRFNLELEKGRRVTCASQNGSLAHRGPLAHRRVTYASTASTQRVTCASMGNDGEMWELSMNPNNLAHAATSSHLTSGWGGVGAWGGWGSNGMIGPRGHIITSYLRVGGVGWGVNMDRLTD